MIASVHGEVESVGADHVIVNVGGFGMQVFVPTSALAAVSIGQRVHLHTHLQFKEDAIALYGFLTTQELRLFHLLTNVNGIGPKTGIKMLSVMSPADLVAAIVTEDPKTLMRVPGVGQKTAARLSLELKGTLSKEWTVGAGVTQAGPSDSEAVSALTALGYSTAEARAALATVTGKDLSIEERLATALRNMGSR